MTRSSSFSTEWRESAIEAVYKAMTEGYDDAWDIGCWDHGTGRRFAEIAVDAIDALNASRNVG